MKKTTSRPRRARRAATAKVRYAAKREQINAQRRASLAASPARRKKQAERERRWRIANRAKILARKKAYRQKNAETIKAYRVKNRARAAVQARMSRTKHRAAINARRRAAEAARRAANPPLPRPSLADRFWSRIPRLSAERPATCWAWNGVRTYNGYGLIKVGRKPTRAHRVAYELLVGPIPTGLLVLHTCDNPPCVNPGHLFLGTARDNMVDAIAKGRWTAKQPTPRRLQIA